MTIENTIAEYALYKKKLEKEFPEKTFSFLGEGGLSYVFLTEYQNKKSAAKIYLKDIHFKLPFEYYSIDLKKLKHKNLMEIYEITPSRIIFSEHCGTITFRQRCEKKEIESLEQNLLAFWDVINTVEYLLSLDLAHTDISENNILFFENANRAKIIDFDLIQQINSNKKNYTHFFLTHCYSAPELINREINEKTDIFSLGSLLYLIVQGDEKQVEIFPKPFDIISDYKFKNKTPKLKNAGEKISSIYSYCPVINNSIIKEMIKKMVDFNPEKRPDINEVKNMFKDSLPEELQKKLNDQ
jgi:serine/threonine protein kinase